MPSTLVLFYRESDGTVPFLSRLKGLKETDIDLWKKYVAFIGLLEDEGNQLRRPQADLLRDDIRELRIKLRSKNYRILYFFSGKNEVTLSHDFLKTTSAVPDREIQIAVERKLKVEKDHNKHTHREPKDNEV